MLVPSLINPPHVLDLDPEVSLASAVANMGRRALLLDWGLLANARTWMWAGTSTSCWCRWCANWGAARARRLLPWWNDGARRSEHRAGRAPRHPRRSVAVLALPRSVALGFACAVAAGSPAAAALDMLPLEVLQAAFWSLDPNRTVSKFATFARPRSRQPARPAIHCSRAMGERGRAPAPSGGTRAGRGFVRRRSARDRQLAGRGRTMRERPPVPALHFTAARDRITPAETAPAQERHQICAGHVGMVVGSARGQLHSALASFLDPACREPT